MSPQGAAAERTVLAWARTMLAYGVCALLALRLTHGSLPVELLVLGGAATGVAGVAVLTARRRRHTALDVPVDPLVTAALAALVSGLGLAAAVLAATH